MEPVECQFHFPHRLQMLTIWDVSSGYAVLYWLYWGYWKQSNLVKLARPWKSLNLTVALSYFADNLHRPAESEFWRRLRSTSSHAVCSPYLTLNLWRPSFSGRRCTDLEQSSAAYHISVTSRLLLSLEYILLRTLLPVIAVVVPAKRQFALTYLLTFWPGNPDKWSQPWKGHRI